MRGWVVPRIGLGDVKKRKFLTLPGLELRLLGRPALSQLLYRLCYPGSMLFKHTIKIIRRDSSLLVQWLAAVLNTGVRFLVMARIFLITAMFRAAL
jgi:hypothetical protein